MRPLLVAGIMAASTAETGRQQRSGTGCVGDECFLTGTAAEVVPVVTPDARKIGDGNPGPITRDLIERFRRLTRE